MTRNEWLEQLVWILYALGDGLESATLVDRATGESHKTGYAIFPCQEPSTVDVREGTNEPLQDAQRDAPLPCYSNEDSAPQIASFLARDGMAGGWEAA